LSLGSNIEREENIRGALHALKAAFGDLVVSQVYESEAVGFAGAPFYNLVVGFETDQGVDELMDCFRRIEADFGRVRGGEKFAARTLDIDLLTYGDLVQERGRVVLPRDEILKYAFVLQPLAEVAGDERHPVSGQRYDALWAAFDKGDQRLWPVPFDSGL